MDEEGASTLYLSGFRRRACRCLYSGGNATPPVVGTYDPCHGRMARPRPPSYPPRLVLISTFVGIASASFTSMPGDMAYTALPAACACATIS